MKLWLLTQPKSPGFSYDTYDSCVVAAETIEQAKDIHPRRGAPQFWWLDSDEFGPLDSWAHPKHITAQLLGEALPDTQPGVILASFNAG